MQTSAASIDFIEVDHDFARSLLDGGRVDAPRTISFLTTRWGVAQIEDACGRLVASLLGKRLAMSLRIVADHG
ncbi:MAG TPA: hypothetical protein VN809_03910, partial [Telmatospirillum sp.]|nr:hypothetical protein [Telmatospirillum sp.]